MNVIMLLMHALLQSVCSFLSETLFLFELTAFYMSYSRYKPDYKIEGLQGSSDN
jgi:hypothetical protein